MSSPPLSTLKFSSQLDCLLDLPQLRSFSDVEICANASDKQRLSLSVHSVVLALSSPSMRRAFTEANCSFPEHNFLALFPEWEENSIISLVTFLYRGAVVGAKDECENLRTLLSCLGIVSEHNSGEITLESAPDLDKRLTLTGGNESWIDPLLMVNTTLLEDNNYRSLHSQQDNDNCDSPDSYDAFEHTKQKIEVDSKENILPELSSKAPRLLKRKRRKKKTLKLKKVVRRRAPRGSGPSIPKYAEVLDAFHDSHSNAKDIESMYEKSTDADKTMTLSCKQCSKSWSGLTTTDKIINHISAVHLKQKRFKCKLCAYTAYYLESLQEHHSTSHADDADQLLKCPSCPFVAAKPSRMKRHMTMHSSERKFKCTVAGCTYAGRLKHMLKTHMYTHNTSEKPHCCTYCSYQTVANAILQQHIRSVHLKLKPFTCEICQQAFGTKGILSQHMLTHTAPEKQLLCNECEHMFSTTLQLLRHKKSMHRDRPYKCDKCSFSAVYSTLLQRHIKTVHLKQKDFKCEHCGYAAAKQCHLRVHLRIHTGEKPYICEYCPYTSPRRSCLKKHETVHTGEKRFKCDQCSYETRYHENLGKHRKIHEKNQSNSCETAPRLPYNKTNFAITTTADGLQK